MTCDNCIQCKLKNDHRQQRYYLNIMNRDYEWLGMPRVIDA